MNKSKARSQKLSIFIISLKNSPRREVISNRLNELGLKYEFVDAIDKADLPPNESSYYDAKSCTERHGRPLVAPEIACFLSHIKAWNTLSKRKIPGIILEDDAIFTASFPCAVNVLADSNVDADAVLLGHSKMSEKNQKKHYFYNPFRSSYTQDSISVGSVYKLWTSGMVGYFLAVGAADKLVKANPIIRCLSDDWSYHAAAGLVIKELRPYPVWEDYVTMPSNIEPERYQASSHRNKIIDYLFEPARFARAVIRNVKSVASSNEKN